MSAITSVPSRCATRRPTITKETSAASAKIAAEGEYLTEASFKIDEIIGAFRIRIEDERGCCAYTQAYGTSADENGEGS